MTAAPTYSIDPKRFWEDPYPDLAKMRAEAPVAYVPELDAILLTRRADVFRCEKIIEVFSSDQPDGLMTKLMGRNLMRKDGAEHMAERKAIFPTISPRTVRDTWRAQFEAQTAAALDDVAPLGRGDMAQGIAKRISGEALKAVTGLTQISWQEMDEGSQAMIDGCANYAGDAGVEARCHRATAMLDKAVEERMAQLRGAPDASLISVQMEAGLPEEQIKANVKLAISGGQNEPRDVIAGTIWALLTHPEQLAKIEAGEATWLNAFEEYVRWEPPIGMSPRRIAKEFDLHGITLTPEQRVFLMFGSANRDEDVFERPEVFDISRDNAASIGFGAGPHFCAGAWISRTLIAEVALPMIFERLKGLRLDGPVRLGGWAFRGPLEMPVAWDA
ncbi:cytochrome P450 [Rhodovulum sp. DZ06]|uniref:cytochrome P450 n=1 Tax=Rhodovulum sp. DZ06 TaxID=3425126 RepID=UPI003D355CEB